MQNDLSTFAVNHVAGVSQGAQCGTRLTPAHQPSSSFSAPATMVDQALNPMAPTCQDACQALFELIVQCADYVQCEELYDELMVLSRRSTLQELSNSKMPVSLKQRYAELRMIDLTVLLFARNPHSCAVILTRLSENIAHGPGHFSVHRAKQALRRIAQPAKNQDRAIVCST